VPVALVDVSVGWLVLVSNPGTEQAFTNIREDLGRLGRESHADLSDGRRCWYEDQRRSAGLSRHGSSSTSFGSFTASPFAATATLGSRTTVAGGCVHKTTTGTKRAIASSKELAGQQTLAALASTLGRTNWRRSTSLVV
jgi:hypothetical protein